MFLQNLSLYLASMKGRFLVSSNEDPDEGNVYADKASLLLIFFDFYYFSLRGQEQGEFIVQLASELKHLKDRREK